MLIEDFDYLFENEDLPFKSPHTGVLPTLLRLLDEVSENSRLFIILVSNEAKPFLSRKLLRPGRIDVHFDLRLPSANDRRELLKHYLSEASYDVSDLETLVRQTPEFSPAELKSLASKAQLLAIHEQSPMITLTHFDEAIHRILYQTIGRPFQGDDNALRRIAIHEMGHALVAFVLDPEHFNLVTLNHWGESLGHLKMLGVDNNVLSKDDYLNIMALTIAGYCAEEKHLNNTSSLAQNDLQSLYQIAHFAVKEFGFEGVY